MHTDLSQHLHTDECNGIIEALKICHDKSNFGRFVGACNELDTAMNKCLKRERLARRQRNRELSFEKQKLVRERIKILKEEQQAA